MGEIIFWLNKRLSAAADCSIGPKAVSLCALRRLGLRVPRCFFVTTDAFREHVQNRWIETQITSLLDSLDAHAESTESVIGRIRDLIAKAPLVHDIEDGIVTAYHQLGAATVAVRSSATAEDLPGRSFAGQYETILSVVSLEDCLDAVKKCWASLWTERAFEYRRQNGIDHRQIKKNCVFVTTNPQ